MSLVKDVLQEELNRLTALKEKYKANISQYPKGTLITKKRFYKEYIYISYRKQNKVVSDYIGLADSEGAKEMEVKINKRKEYEAKLKKINQNLKEVKSALRNREQ